MPIPVKYHRNRRPRKLPLKVATLVESTIPSRSPLTTPSLTSSYSSRTLAAASHLAPAAGDGRLPLLPHPDPASAAPRCCGARARRPRGARLCRSGAGGGVSGGRAQQEEEKGTGGEG